MSNASLEKMAGPDGPNKALVMSIGQLNSQFINRQAREFPPALERLGCLERTTEVFCFYETAESPTAIV